MFSINNGKIPTGALLKSGTMTSSNKELDGLVFYYYATKTREHVYAYKAGSKHTSDNLVFSYFVNRVIKRGLVGLAKDTPSKEDNQDRYSVRVKHYEALNNKDEFLTNMLSWFLPEDDLKALGMLDRSKSLNLGFNLREDDLTVHRMAFKGIKYNIYSPNGNATATSGGHSVNKDAVDWFNMIKEHTAKLDDLLYVNVPFDKLIAGKDLSWVKKKDYRVLLSRKDFYDFVAELDKCKDIVGFDTETTGLKANRFGTDRLVGMSLSVRDNSGVYIPIMQKRSANCEVPLDEILHALAPYLDCHSKKRKPLIAHNGYFDWRVMKFWNIELNLQIDTYVMDAILFPQRMHHTLKGLAKKIFGIDVIEMDEMYEGRGDALCTTLIHLYEQYPEVFKDEDRYLINKLKYTDLKLSHVFQKEMLDFRYADARFYAIYCPADADFPRMLYRYYQQTVPKKRMKEKQFIMRLEVNTIPMLGEQMYYGVHVDQDGYRQLSVHTENEMKELKKEIYKLAGQEFNINSTKQKVDILFGKMKIPAKDKYRSKKTHQLGLGKKVIDDLLMYHIPSDDGEDKLKYPIVKLLQQYTKKEKLLNSFYHKLPRMVINGYVFPIYNALGTATGRLACKSPNIQQTEPNSRDYMLPDDDDHYFMVGDYSQAEYRINAGITGEKKVIKFFNDNPEADYHILAYANMKHKPYEDVTGKERKQGKVLNFANMYGVSPASLAVLLYGKDDAVSVEMARRVQRDYLNGIPNSTAYLNHVRDVSEYTAKSSTAFGRERIIPKFWDMQNDCPKPHSQILRKDIGSGRRQAGNMTIQGTAADVLKLALIRLRMNFRRYGLYEKDARAVLNVHDEVCYCISKRVNPWFALAIFRQAMEIDLSNVGKYGDQGLGIPQMHVSGNVGYNWHDGKADELESPVLLQEKCCAEAMRAYHENGDDWTKLPTYDDVREFWFKEIEGYTFNVMEEEVKRGYKLQASDTEFQPINGYGVSLNNSRLTKYSKTLSVYAPMVIKTFVMHKGEKGFAKVFHENYEHYKTYATPEAKKMLSEARALIAKGNYTSVDSIKADSVLSEVLVYFCKWDGYVAKELLAGSSDQVILDHLKEQAYWQADEDRDYYIYMMSRFRDMYNLKSYEDMVASDKVQWALKYFPIGKKQIVQDLADGKFWMDVDKAMMKHLEYDELKGKLPNGKEKQRVKAEGKLDLGDKGTLKAELSKVLKIDRQAQTVLIDLPEDDLQLYSNAESLLLPNNNLIDSNKVKFYKLGFVLQGKDTFYETGRILTEKALRLLYRLMIGYVTKDQDILDNFEFEASKYQEQVRQAMYA